MRSFIFILFFSLMFTAVSYTQDHSEHKNHTMKNDSVEVKSENPEVTKPWNTICPVMQEEVDPEVQTVSYNGKEYGFCCKSCIKKFKKDPEKYSKKLSEDGTKILKVD